MTGTIRILLMTIILILNFNISSQNSYEVGINLDSNHLKILNRKTVDSLIESNVFYQILTSSCLISHKQCMNKAYNDCKINILWVDNITCYGFSLKAKDTIEFYNQYFQSAYKRKYNEFPNSLIDSLYSKCSNSFCHSEGKLMKYINYGIGCSPIFLYQHNQSKLNSIQKCIIDSSLLIVLNKYKDFQIQIHASCSKSERSTKNNIPMLRAINFRDYLISKKISRNRIKLKWSNDLSYSIEDNGNRSVYISFLSN